MPFWKNFNEKGFFRLVFELRYKLVIQIRQERRRRNKPILSDTNWKRLNKVDFFFNIVVAKGLSFANDVSD